jgi:uncharacterized protein with HEPN domain
VSLPISIDHERITEFCRRSGIRRLSFFGSVLRDDFGAESDVDVLVEFEPEATEALALAVPHAVEIVGEAASRVSRPFCEAHPEVAWSEVTGMRHRIVHDYFAVDYQRLWDTVHSDLPPLIEQLERIPKDVGGA